MAETNTHTKKTKIQSQAGIEGSWKEEGLWMTFNHLWHDYKTTQKKKHKDPIEEKLS